MKHLNRLKETIQYSAVGMSIITLVGCSATQTALEHRTLEVSTKQSETIFLDPVPSSQKTVYIAIKNTSDQTIKITPQLKAALVARGYHIMSQPNQAHYLLQANVLTVGKMSVAASKSALGGGYGSAIAGGIAGVAAGSLTHQTNGLIVGGIAGGVLGLAADSLVKAVNYTMVTDVQISERVGRGIVSEQFNASLKNGTSSGTQQTINKTSDYQRYRTRVVSNADKVNLSFGQARPALEQGLVKIIAGTF